MTLASVPELLDELRAGRPVVLVDDEDRENEGDLVLPAELATPELVNFMAREGRGLICVAVTPERARALDLPLMVERGTDPNGTAFTVSVDHVSTSTGISAPDRAATVRALVDPACRPEDLRRPGHVFPLVA
ncbi:3,4-dihydroxy-2-butanone-4-phosphate synthase, partial [Deinococcus pimensis]|uniref:3,4-dihydroxy-2-butanone-4-phosphate synthase n=1 Tax=Deinococcus pimensis TaxID=309888 RepID=UPI00047F18EC